MSGLVSSAPRVVQVDTLVHGRPPVHWNEGFRRWRAVSRRPVWPDGMVAKAPTPDQDLGHLPARRRGAGDRVDQDVAAHLLEAAVVGPIPAGEDRVHDRLHVVVEAVFDDRRRIDPSGPHPHRQHRRCGRLGPGGPESNSPSASSGSRSAAAISASAPTAPAHDVRRPGAVHDGTLKWPTEPRRGYRTPGGSRRPRSSEAGTGRVRAPRRP